MNRLFSDHLPIPAPAGKPRYENRGADWWRCLRFIYRPYPTPGFRLSPESPWPCEGRNKRIKIAGRRGSLAGKTLRPYGVPHPWTPAPYLGTGHAFDRRSDELGVYSHSNRSCRLAPALQGMKSRSCGLVQRIGTADSATPYPDPSGGQAPALHFLVPPSIIDLQFGTFRPGRAGIEVDWRAHPGSESGTCFRTNDGTGRSKGSRLFSYKCPECGPSGSGLAIMISGGSGSRH